MKLSSAFDPALLMNGCTGKTSHAMDEVAAITEDRMSYMDKSGSMKGIENRQDMSDVVWSGIFNLSDEHGVNTIAYGSSGTIYGCYNYDNLNVASYSKSYAGNDIMDAAYAVGETVKTDGDGGDASSVGGSSSFGVMIGISKDHLYIYTETKNTEGTVSKTWSLAEFSSTGGTALDEENLEIYRIFSAGRMFFVTTNQGVICFSASDVNLSSFRIDIWEFLPAFPPASMLSYEDDESSLNAARTAAVKNIQFIRLKEFEFTERNEKISAYAVAWSIGASSDLMSCVLLQRIESQWKSIPLFSNKNGTLSDIIPLSQVSFPCDVKTSIPVSYPSTPDGETVKWINKESISILPKRVVEGSNEYTIVSNVSGIPVNELKMKTQNGYTILATNALVSENEMVDNRPDEYIDDSFIPNLYSYISTSRKWKYEKPFAILDASEPLPKHLTANGLYWVAKSNNNGEFYSRWIENYEVRKNPGSVDPTAVAMQKDSDFHLSEETIQLFNDQEEPARIAFNAENVLQNKIIVKKFVAIERTPENSTGYQFSDIENSTSSTTYYCRWNAASSRWNSTFVSQDGYPTVPSLVDYSSYSSSSSSVGTVERVYGYTAYASNSLPSLVYLDQDQIFYGSSSFSSNVLSFDFRVNPDSTTDFFNRIIHFRAGFYVIDKPEINFTEIEKISTNDEQKQFKIALLYEGESTSPDDLAYAILYYNTSTDLPSKFQLVETNELNDLEDITFPASFDYDSIEKIKVSAIPRRAILGTLYPANVQIQTSSTKVYVSNRSGSLTEVDSYLLSDFEYTLTSISRNGCLYRLSNASQSSTEKNASRRIVYSSTGILSSDTNDDTGEIKGNWITCKLAFANAIDAYKFSISDINKERLNSLIPDENYSKHVLECMHSYKLDNTTINRAYPAGLVKMTRNGNNLVELSFSKNWDDSIQTVPIPWNGIGTFKPKINNGQDNFIIEIPCTKTFLAYSLDANNNSVYKPLTKEVTLTLEISEVSVVDMQNWNGQYREYFQDSELLTNSEWHYIPLSSTCLAFTTEEAISGQPLQECPQSRCTEQAEAIKIEFDEKYGCKIPFDSAIPAISYEIGQTASSSDTSCYVVGDTRIWSLTGENGLLQERYSISCLNFGREISQFHQYAALTEEEGIIRTFSLEEDGNDLWLNVSEENTGRMLEEWNNNLFISSPVDENTPIFVLIDGSIKMFFMEPSTDPENEISNPSRYHLREVKASDAANASELGQLASIFIQHHESKILHAFFNETIFSIPNVNFLCTMKYDAENKVEVIEQSENSINALANFNIDRINSPLRFAVLKGSLVEVFNLQFTIEEKNLVPVVRNASSAFKYMKASEALKKDLMVASGNTWKKFSVNSEGKYLFGSTVSIGSIPYVQYSELKQIRLNSSPARKLVQWNANSLSSESFSLYVQSTDPENLWNPSSINYDSSRTYLISSTGGWPEFYPSIGNIYTVTEPHLTGSGTRYGVGNYIYVGDGSTIEQCYAKLPYMDNLVHSTGLSWTLWMNNPKQTFLMVIGSSSGVSFGKLARVSVASDGTLIIESQFNSNFDSKPSQSFRIGLTEALPHSNCIYSAAVDSSASKQEVYATITLGSFKIALLEYGDFLIPRLTGLFASGQSSIFGISDAIVNIDISENINIYSIMDELQLASGTSIIGLTTRVNPGSKTTSYPSWIWEASLVPYSIQIEQYEKVFVVAAAGMTTCRQVNNGMDVRVDKRYLYAKSLSKGSITNSSSGRNGDSALPRIYPPLNDESTEDAEKEYVVYDEYGFYVKSSGIYGGDSTGDTNVPKDLSGTDAMSSMSKIIGMTTFKAYNFPIVVGLYEKGGLILYYGTRCFDRSILGTKRFVYNADTDIEDSFASYVNQRMMETYGSNEVNTKRILLAYLKGTDNISRAIQLYAPEYSGNSTVFAAMNAKIQGNAVPSNLSEEEKNAIAKIEMAIIREEERSLAENEADENFIKSYEYSVNNSTESQWINIPIYVRRGNEYAEVDETLTSLTSAMAGGRIRLSVGTASGNVYWRDLNPLHADKYISYIPTGLLSQKEQNEIAQIEEDPENAELKKFLFGNSVENGAGAQNVVVGWTDWIWTYNGSNPVSGHTEYIARQSSECISDNGSTKWLIANGKDIGMELTDAEASMVQNPSTYAPYVRRRSWKWVLGGKQTSFSAYANEPEVRMTNGRPVWYFNGQSTGITAVPGVYPKIVINNNVKSWMIGEELSGIIGPVIENGRPYINNRTWMIQEYGKSSPTEIFTLDSKDIIVQTMEKEKAIDFWAINGRPVNNFSTSENITPITKFSTDYRPCWKFKNVMDSTENGAFKSSLSTPYSSKTGGCPFILEPQCIGVINTVNETPIWKSTAKNSFNESCVECDMFFVEPIGTTNRAYVRTVENTKSLEVSGTLAEGETLQNLKFFIGMSGKEWWLLPEPDGSGSQKSRIGPYVSDATPQSRIGTRWKCNRIVDNSVKEWDSFDAPQNSKVEEDFVEEINQETGAAETVKCWFINGINTGLRCGHYTKPKLKCSIWQWTLSSDLHPIIRESGTCPYKKRPEYCMWFNGLNVGKIQNIGSPQLFTGKSESTLHWFVDGVDTGIKCLPEYTSTVSAIPPSTASGRWKFEWRVKDADSLNDVLVAATSSCANPITKEVANSWWMKDKNGNLVDTKINAMDPLRGKGLESDGIASRMVSETYWNEEKKKYETVGPQRRSWTPLASLFVDAYSEVSYGVLESIKNPWSTENPDIMKKGMVWEMISSKDLFGTSGVYIAESKSTSWDSYEEGDGAGNASAYAFDVYIGWKRNEDRNDLYDSYCTIRSIETGAVTKWTVYAKDWKFEHLELVVKSNGKLNNIVILASKGWIVSTNSISYANEGKDIKAIVWNSPVNPVADVLNEIEKIVQFKWNSWDSNEISEFAAVGSYGVYVYSPDCIRFTASIPYGDNAELIEIVWNPKNSEFKIWGVDVALDDDSSTSTTIAKGEGIDYLGKEEDFETAYEKNAVNASQGKSVSINSLNAQTIYKHHHKRMDGVKETLYYQFSEATTSFDEITNVTDSQDENAVFIVADLPYRFTNGTKTWTYVYSKCNPSTKEVLGAGYLINQVSWKWMWVREEIKTESKKMSYITVSENTKSVAYGFPDLKRFIKSYKNLYTNALEFVGGVCQFASSERDSANIDGKSLKEAYEELAKIDGLKIYSENLDVAWNIFKQAKRLRDASHYAENDCYNTYLQKIGQSLALEHQDYFNKAKQAMWTAQAFKNYYAGLVAKGTSANVQLEQDAVGGDSYKLK